ncbi:MAG: virulence RhuM family protein [Lachnospiraceae bacterium]|nr:virulence RhuM family protein [Lachnospiraceae bacterium]
MPKSKKEVSIRSGAAEYLTYVASNGGNTESFEILYQDEDIWITQKMMANLYDVSKSTISEHISKVFSDSELDEKSTVRKFRTVQTEGNVEKGRYLKHYNLQMIIAVGFKVNSDRAVQFRKWVNQIAREYTIKGWVIDSERLKEGSYLTDKYYDELLETIREIRLSERRFYQKITDIYATSVDYDRTASTTREFFAKVQNKMHYAVHGHTAAELIYERADAEKEHMGLNTWKYAPDGKIIKTDVSVAKNYLSDSEIKSLERIVSAYLDLAEDRAERHIPMTMEDWSKRLDLFLAADDREVLQDAGKITAEIARQKAESEFEKYRVIQDKLFMSDYDKYLLEIEKSVKENK